MQVQSICHGFYVPKFKSSNRRPISRQIVTASRVQLKGQNVRFPNALHKKYKFEGCLLRGLKGGAIVCAASNSISEAKLEFSGRGNSGVPLDSYHGVEPFRGKSGSVSFYGLTYQLMEEAKLMSAPFPEGKGSLLWVLAPVALISSLIVPQFFLGEMIENLVKNQTLLEIVTSLAFESMFYVGLAIFLLVTDHVQRPYLQYSAKRWGLITGLRGYLSSAFFTMGLKVVAPLFAVYITWPMLGLPALVAVIPFLVGCAAQLAFETCLDKRGSSCWPLIPIIFEVYRLYQLTRATHFIERLMLSMKDLPGSPKLMEKGGAMISMVVTFQILGVICLWSLLTFLLRLFPSRPVVENY